MTENKIIETHIAENIHRIEVIEWFMRSNSSADKEKCEKNKKVLTSVNGLLQEIQQYRAIGTIEECRTAVERMKPKKVTYQGEHEKCPSCGSFHVFGKHCTECGQAVDYD